VPSSVPATLGLVEIATGTRVEWLQTTVGYQPIAAWR
jgi:hypothetical protein